MPEIDGDGEDESVIDEDLDICALPLGDALVVSPTVKLKDGVALLESVAETVEVSVSRGD